MRALVKEFVVRPGRVVVVLEVFEGGSDPKRSSSSSDGMGHRVWVGDEPQSRRTHGGKCVPYEPVRSVRRGRRTGRGTRVDVRVRSSVRNDLTDRLRRRRGRRKKRVKQRVISAGDDADERSVQDWGEQG